METIAQYTLPIDFNIRTIVKKILILALICLLIACETNQDLECLIACPVSNVNDQVELTVKFLSIGEADSIDVIRIMRSDNSIIDTTVYRLNADKALIIGSGGEISFSAITSGSDISAADLNFHLVTANGTSTLSDIDIRDVSGECECPKFILSTLKVNGQVFQANTNQYTISL